MSFQPHNAANAMIPVRLRLRNDGGAKGDKTNQFDPKVARLIDHTLLKADATRAEVRRVCEEAQLYEFASVCVNPFWVDFVRAELAGSVVKTCTVAGFPLGANLSEIKAAEAGLAVRHGAGEVDMVLNIGALRAEEYAIVKNDIQDVVRVCHDAGAIVKVILETALLTDEQKVTACRIAQDAGADFVKTSTGFGPSGATVHDVALMRKSVGSVMGVKASGGIRTLEDFRKMVAAGASRVGASASVRIVEASAV